MMVALCMVVGAFGITFCWLLLKMARWSAPLSGLVGLLIWWGALYLGSFRAEWFGAGLFGFSMLLFLLGGGMRGR